jgi:hypothetical protein
MSKYECKYKRVRRFSEAEKKDIARRYAAGELLKVIAYKHNSTTAVISEIGRSLTGKKRTRGPQVHNTINNTWPARLIADSK